MNGLYKALENLVWVGQLGLSLLMPLVLCLALCWWLNTSVGVGGWVYLPGLLLGLGAGGVNFRDFARRWLKQTQKEQKDRPAGFNRH